MEIGAGDLRSRGLHVDLHAELHHVENGRPADSAPYFVRLAGFSFNWRDPSPKNVKSSCSSRRKSVLCERDRRLCPVLFPFEEQTWFQLLDSEIINAKVLLRTRDDNWASPESFERGMGEVDGGL